MAPRRWNKTALRTLLEDLRPYIHFLQERELYMLLQHTGALPALRFALNKVSPFELIQVLRLQYPDLVQTLDTFPENGIEELSVAPDTSLPQTANLALSLMAKPQSVFLQAYPESSKHYHIDEDMSGRQVNMLSAYLHAIDHLTDQFDLDEEMAMYLIDNRVSALWERYSNEGEEVLCKLLAEDGGRFFQEVKQRFLAEIAAVERLPIPSGWSFTDEQGRLAFPNHMQRYIAWAVREKRRQGNWSGTGAGKTLAAILSTRVCQAHVTLVVMNIATIENWRTQILQAYPNSIIHLDVPPASLLDRQGFHYILLNYEQFQTTGRQHLVERLLACRLDEIVLDEVQFVKQRGQKESSRRKSITALLTGAERDNPALCVLVMSATPVINNLVEGKTLVELLLGKSLPELGTIPTVDNALALHRALLRSGFRYQPRSQQELATHILPITCNDLLEHLQVIEWSTLAMETVQLPYKLETIRSFIQPGTVFYTYFIAEGRMIDTICAFIKRLGLTVGRYTGTDKSGLELFLGGQVDVLVGSKPLGTGLNGLQTRANRLIILSLPWTSAEYDQLLGRLWRQGSRFQAVEIFIPQVILEVAGESWSYDRARLAVIQEKRTLSDCVIDGRIPASVRVTERALLQQSRAALEQWIARINKVSV